MIQSRCSKPSTLLSYKFTWFMCFRFVCFFPHHCSELNLQYILQMHSSCRWLITAGCCANSGCSACVQSCRKCLLFPACAIAGVAHALQRGEPERTTRLQNEELHSFHSSNSSFFVHERANSWEAIIPLNCRPFACWRIHHSSCVRRDNQWEEMSSSATHSRGRCWRLFPKVINCALKVQFGEPGQLGCRHLHRSQLPECDSSPPGVCSAGISSTDYRSSLGIRGVWGVICQVEYFHQF